ncbi:DUF3794 domain-containing protein [Clostridium sp. B9]|uniref:DUF3794 domain-containing protein n=1 Tax=Clostridium sp. B9 TaxID=3423224 RepID=UPI003D2F34E7
MKSNSNTCNCDLIDIIGLCTPENTTAVIKDFPYWKQMYVSETLEVPPQKPDMEQINSVDISVSIFRQKVIKTPRSYDDTTTPPTETPNLEGKLLTGRKLIIEGQLCQKIVYTADEDEQPVHSVHFYVPFSSYVVVPKEYTFTNSDGSTYTIDSLNITYEVNSCIEDVAICMLDERRLLKQVTLLLYAVPTQC